MDEKGLKDKLVPKRGYQFQGWEGDLAFQYMTNQPVHFHQKIGQPACLLVYTKTSEESLSSQDFSTCDSMGIASGKRPIFFKVEGEFAYFLEDQGRTESLQQLWSSPNSANSFFQNVDLHITNAYGLTCHGTKLLLGQLIENVCVLQ